MWNHRPANHLGYEKSSLLKLFYFAEWRIVGKMNIGRQIDEQAFIEYMLIRVPRRIFKTLCVTLWNKIPCKIIKWRLKFLHRMRNNFRRLHHITKSVKIRKFGPHHMVYFSISSKIGHQRIVKSQEHRLAFSKTSPRPL